MNTALQWLMLIAGLGGPFVVLACWALVNEDVRKRGTFLEQWLGVMFVQATTGALCWLSEPHRSSLPFMLILPAVTSLFVGPVLAFFFGTDRNGLTAYVAFTLAWFASFFAIGAVVLMSFSMC